MPKKRLSYTERKNQLNLIVNVLNAHANELFKCINDLRPISKRIGGKGELTNAFERVEEKISSFQNDVANLAKLWSTSSQETRIPAIMADFKEHQGNSTPAFVSNVVPFIVRYKLWEDFKVFAFQAEKVTFQKNCDRTFEGEAIKNNQLLIYSGELPDSKFLLRLWLSKQLDVSEKKVIEGILTTD